MVLNVINDICKKSKVKPCPIPAKKIAEVTGYPLPSVYVCIRRLELRKNLKIQGNTRPYRYTVLGEANINWRQHLLNWIQYIVSKFKRKQ